MVASWANIEKGKWLTFFSVYSEIYNNVCYAHRTECDWKIVKKKICFFLTLTRSFFTCVMWWVFDKRNVKNDSFKVYLRHLLCDHWSMIISLLLYFSVSALNDAKNAICFCLFAFSKSSQKLLSQNFHQNAYELSHFFIF